MTFQATVFFAKAFFLILKLQKKRKMLFIFRGGRPLMRLEKLQQRASIMTIRFRSLRLYRVTGKLLGKICITQIKYSQQFISLFVKKCFLFMFALFLHLEFLNVKSKEVFNLYSFRYIKTIIIRGNLWKDIEKVQFDNFFSTSSVWVSLLSITVSSKTPFLL